MPKPKRIHNYTYKPIHYPRHSKVKEPSMKDMIAAGGCWCGESYGHDWEGKSEGAPHPR